MSFFRNKGSSRTNKNTQVNSPKSSRRARHQNTSTDVQPPLDELGRRLKGVYDSVADECAKLLDQIADYIPIEKEIFQEMSYEDAIGYFVNERPRSNQVAKGAMLRDEHPRGYLFIQIFLDRNNNLVCDKDEVPFGRQVIVEYFDDELAETFGNQDMVIVE
ncbi:MAG: hypothetical protein AAGE84_21565 [Cyanobacteria bacterium P01_G01_bin.39]